MLSWTSDTHYAMCPQHCHQFCQKIKMPLDLLGRSTSEHLLSWDLVLQGWSVLQLLRLPMRLNMVWQPLIILGLTVAF